ncbi:hypothetical protein ONZ45_g8222 [Pleurotus djamor]|nr:hypothetical protein ONZ45_g8222 [Pleurotus djamor]
MSATTRALRVPELLSHIFSFATTKDNGQNLLVCKLWSNEVLNIEWKDIIDVTRLFRVLAPLGSRSTSPVRFTRQLTPEDWVRFDRYAWRITSLEVSLLDIDISLYTEITASRNRLDFLPNLRELSIPGVTIAVQLFAHASVTSFTVYPAYKHIHDEYEIKGALLLSHIRHRMPNLRSLSIEFSFPSSSMDEIQSEATLALASLKKLSHLVLPPAWVTDSITKTISELPNLQTLDASYLELARSEDLDTPLFSTDLTASSFPKLSRLSIWISYPRAVACFSQANRLASLEVLGLSATHLATREELKHLIAIIASSYPRLTALRLDGARPFSDSDDVPEELGLRFQDLEPLVSCKSLTHLRIMHNLPFLLNASDIYKLLEHLQWLTDLYLNAMPRIQSPSPLPISCLSSIASACPSLSTLSLYVSTSPSDVPTTDPMATFKSLRYLDVGYSRLEKKDIAPVAFYLGHTLPQNCQVLSFSPVVRDPALQLQGSPSVAHWDEVCRLAPMFRKAVENGELLRMHLSIATSTH